MAQGTIKWFNATKGYGFIQPNDSGKDVFVHITAVERSGMTGQDMHEGAKIEFEIEPGKDGKQAATNLKLV